MGSYGWVNIAEIILALIIIVSLQELLQCLEASGQTGSNPFPSHLFALLFFLIHSPHPLVCNVSLTTMWHVCSIIQGNSNLTFFWFILRTAGLVVPTMNAVKTFKLPGYLPPTHVIFYVLYSFRCNYYFFLSQCLSPHSCPYYYISMSSIIFHCLGQELASSLVRYPVESTNTFR